MQSASLPFVRVYPAKSLLLLAHTKEAFDSWATYYSSSSVQKLENYHKVVNNYFSACSILSQKELDDVKKAKLITDLIRACEEALPHFNLQKYGAECQMFIMDLGLICKEKAEEKCGKYRNLKQLVENRPSAYGDAQLKTLREEINDLVLKATRKFHMILSSYPEMNMAQPAFSQGPTVTPDKIPTYKLPICIDDKKKSHDILSNYCCYFKTLHLRIAKDTNERKKFAKDMLFMGKQIKSYIQRNYNQQRDLLSDHFKGVVELVVYYSQNALANI